MKILLLLIFLNFALSSCATQVNHGYMFEYSDYNLLEIGNNKNTVLDIMGSPTIKSQIDENDSWLYMHEHTASFLFFKPKIVKREILVLNFSEDNVVEILNFNLLDQEKNFHFESKTTEVLENKVGIFKYLFSNIGNVKPL